MISLFPSRAVALSLFGLEIHWYGLLYLLGFLIAALLLPRLQKFRGLSLTRDEWMSLLSWSVVGVIAGGRLGYVMFYEPAYFLGNPGKLIAVWEGGMSFHGGLIGVLIVLLLFTRRHGVSLPRLFDVIVVPVAIGLSLGRLGNFINQELYGTVTTFPWGIAIPGVEGLRHPTQLYAVVKDLLIAALCFWHLRHSSKLVGHTGSLFLLLYGVGRFLLEFLRQQQYAVTVLLGISLTRGQLLTIPVVIGGIFLWIIFSKSPYWRRKH